MFQILRKKPAPVAAPSTGEPPKLLDDAARTYLAGDTVRANALVAEARAQRPDYFLMMEAQTRGLHGDLRAAIAAGTVERHIASDHYTDEHVAAYWNSAHRECTTSSPEESANAMLFAMIRDKIGAAIHKLQPDGVCEFGCAYGLPLRTLADRFPGTAFCGVDRQELLRDRNTEMFATDNLSFRSGSILDALEMPGEHKLLMHVRTGIMVYPAFLDLLYRRARENGYRFIISYEIASLSCISWQYRDQDTGFAAEAHRSTMFIHDYAAAMRRAGFTPSVERMPHGYAMKRNPMLPGDTYAFVIGEC